MTERNPEREPPLCISRKGQCNPARVYHCQCWWESADPGDFNRNYEEAMRLALGEQEPTR